MMVALNLIALNRVASNRPKSRKRMYSRQSLAGQSLVEFVLVMPILVLILLGGFSFGLGTYQAHMASNAVQFALLNATKMANEPGAVGGGTIQGYINAGGLKGNLSAGSPVDGVTLDATTGVLTATKNFSPLVSFVPGFTIHVGQVVNPGLLKPISSGGAQSRPAGTAWVPGGTMNPPPWTEGGDSTSGTDTGATTPPAA